MRLGLHSLAFTPLWDPAHADQLLPPILEHGVSVIETPLLDPKAYESGGTRSAADRRCGSERGRRVGDPVTVCRTGDCLGSVRGHHNHPG